MKQLSFYMFDITMLFYIPLPYVSNLNALCSIVDSERFFVFTLAHGIRKSGRLCLTVCVCVCVYVYIYIYIKSFGMWCWRRMEKISWTDHVRNEE